MKKLQALFAILVIGSVAACGDLPFEPQVDDTITVEERQVQRGLMGSGS